MKKQYKLADGIELAANYGLTHVCLREDDIKTNPMVWVEQDFWPNGREVARFRKSRGKYKGNSLGFAKQPGFINI